ncbi:MAG: hypothetical protein EBT42_08190 [Actinobacteria bacterium]|nr:hypothetical protein [Actinomycetota bacterium]
MRRRKRRVRQTHQPRPHELADSFVLRYADLQIHDSALKHGISEFDIRHAYENSIALFMLDQESHEVKILIIGPDSAGNLLETIVLEKEDQSLLVIHSMKIRKSMIPLIERIT